MFQEIKPGLLQSSIFSPDRIMHGFSLRALGDIMAVAARKRVKRLLDADTYRLIAVEQVHSSNVHEAQESDFGKTVMGNDGLVLHQRRLSTRGLVMTIAADCVLVLLADEQKGIVGCFHAGWRGTLEQIAAKTVNLMRADGAQAENIKVAIGPSICPRCYEVSPDHARTFQRMFGTDVVEKKKSKWYVDLALANAMELKRTGVRSRNIDTCTTCTFENPQLFSWRRERPRLSGEHVAMIGFRIKP